MHSLILAFAFHEMRLLMTQTTIPSGDNTLLLNHTMREIGRFERIVGPENYRDPYKGLFKTPASIIGFFLIVSFSSWCAVGAPLIMPPSKRTGDPYTDSARWFSVRSHAPWMTEWKRNAPAIFLLVESR